jgi:hypothetical protein
MTEYEIGFDAGERQAFKDRSLHLRRARGKPMSERERGFDDGYFPRSEAWALRAPSAADAWWVERTGVAA